MNIPSDPIILAKKWPDKQPARATEDVVVHGALAVDAYYDSGRKEFLMRNEAGRWLSHPYGQFQMLLKTAGIAPTRAEADMIASELINTRDVSYTGNLAGHRAGFYEANGVRMTYHGKPQAAGTRARRVADKFPAPSRWPAWRRSGVRRRADDHVLLLALERLRVDLDGPVAPRSDRCAGGADSVWKIFAPADRHGVPGRSRR